MPTALAIGGFLALLALVTAGLAAWLVGRSTDRIARLERQLHALAEECRQLHLKFEAASLEAAACAAQGQMAAAPERAAEPAVAYPVIAVDSGMNLNKRVQILRLSRRGESAAHIASLLGLPQSQVELVLKLQRQQSVASPAQA